MKAKYYLLVLLFIPIGIIAQKTPQGPPEYMKNGAFTKDHNSETISAYAYPDIEEKDIVWSRTIWREIDMKQKFNHHFYFPDIQKREFLDPKSMSLIDVVMEELYKQASYEISDPSVERDTVTGLSDCYHCKGKGNSSILSPNSVSTDDSCIFCKSTGKIRLNCFKIGAQTIPGKEFDWGLNSAEETVNFEIPRTEDYYLPDENGVDSTIAYNLANVNMIKNFKDPTGEIIGFKLIENGPNTDPPTIADGKGRILLPKDDQWFDRTLVMRWRIKEEIFFDKKRSSMSTRIIGLCPVIMDYKDPLNGTLSPEKELFWIYYPDWRDIFSRTIVVNLTKNDAQKRSYLDLFEKRMFGSTITMESNIMNRTIRDYSVGVNAVLESERIKSEIFNIEQDMWEY